MQDNSHFTTLPAGVKNYVFVDEHNRQKRLKVIRACDACRRRKIKCDSATTNTWPCAGCVRLKLQCVPPAGTTTTGDETDGQSALLSADSLNISAGSASGHVDGQYLGHPPHLQEIQYSESPNGPPIDASVTPSLHNPSFSNFQKVVYSQLSNQQTPLRSQSRPQPQIQTPSFTQHNTVIPPSRPFISSVTGRQSSEELVQHLGALRIGEDGVAEYVRQQSRDRKEPDVPRVEVELNFGDFENYPGSRVQIPSSMMPSDEEALRLFALFFIHVHPYMPVLCRSLFYHQWHNQRELMSPLLLEAVFACATRVSETPDACLQWIGLAEKHVMLYTDSPRISTLQAILLLLKAKERNPRKGYFYKSWMTCKTVVAMAKDLDLHSHRETHHAGESCGDELSVCLVKTRLWQTIFLCETVIGGPQGRADRGVDPDTVEISPNYIASDIDEYERQISRQYSYAVRNVHGVRLAGDAFREMKKNKSSSLDRHFANLNTVLRQYDRGLPADLKITIPDNGAPPNIPSHFIGNLAIYYQLSILVLHRPQLSISQSFTSDETWKHHMRTCCDAARAMCQLQEAMLSNYGLPGLDYMIRGFSFTNYATLTCIMIHLIALTSPDPEFHTNARDFFVRHMRILERSSAAWSMPETVGQIDSLRAAFSADLSKPFELKASFPLGTPPMEHHSTFLNRITPEPAVSYLQYGQQYVSAQFDMARSSSTPTPPISTKSADSKPHSPDYQQAYNIEHNLSTSPYVQNRSAAQASWNPNPIIKQFSTAFVAPIAALAGPTSAYSTSPSGSLHSLHGGYIPTSSPVYTTGPNQFPQYYPEMAQQIPGQQYFPSEQGQFMAQHSTPVMVQLPQNHVTTPPVTSSNPITARDWQQSVANAYGSGGVIKRTWDYQ